MNATHRICMPWSFARTWAATALLAMLLNPVPALTQNDPRLFSRRWEARAQMLTKDTAWQRLMITNVLTAFHRLQASYDRWDDSMAITFIRIVGRSYASADSQTCLRILEAGPTGFEVLLSVDSVTAEHWVAWFEWVMRRGVGGPSRPIATRRQVDSVRVVLEQRVRAANPGVDSFPAHRICSLHAQYIQELVKSEFAAAVIRASAVLGAQERSP